VTRRRREPFAAALVIGLVVIAAALAGWESVLVRPSGRIASPRTSDSPSAGSQTAAPIDAIVSAGSPFPACVLPGRGRTYTGAEVEPSLAVNPIDPSNLIAVWQQDRSSDGAARGIVTGVTHDAGRTWTRSSSPFGRCVTGGNGAAAYDRVSDPWVSCGPTGICFQSALGASEGGGSGILVSRSTDRGRTWSAAQRIAASTRRDGFNDKETITADPNDPNAVYVVWDRTIEQGEAGTPRSGPDPPDQVMLARSFDGGRTWDEPRAIARVQGTPLGNQLVVLPDRSLVNVFEFRLPRTEASGGSRQQVIRSTDRGATWSQPITIATVTGSLVTDPRTRRRVRSGDALPEIAVDPRNGRVFVVWTDSRFAPPGSSAGRRRTAIALSQSSDGGVTWSEPQNVNLTQPDAFAFTPTVEVDGNGQVAVGYYDLRNDTLDGAAIAADYFVATSSDGALPWTETRLTRTSLDLRLAPQSGGYFLGDYMGLATGGGRFVAAFVETSSASDPTRVVVRTVP
jgi:BNR repeat protein